jgi:hypothetical protein
VLLAPTFKTTPEKLQHGRAYYYPEQGSGAEVERLQKYGRKNDPQISQITTESSSG